MMVPRTNIIIGLIVIFAFTAFMAGCDRQSDDIPTGVPVSVESLIGDGWDSFTNADFSQAVTDFSDAYSRDATSIEAYLGAAWSYMRDAKYSLAVSNINNVFSLISLGTGDTAYHAQYKTEGYACLAGAYQGLYLGDIDTYAPLVVQNVDNALMIDPSFVFSHDNGVNTNTLLVAKADAYYVQDDFLNALVTISELDDSIYQNTAILVAVTVDIVVETLFDSTTVYGYGRLTIPDAQIIDVLSITKSNVPYQIDGFTQGGNQVTFYGTPIPQSGDVFTVNYYNSPDYTAFLIELRNIIDSYRYVFPF
ncbi:hypothetical protein ISS30_01560 [bacterium]|nr:hypothetical protein [bacterium]